VSAPELDTVDIVCPACGTTVTTWHRENGGPWPVPKHRPDEPGQRAGGSSPWCWTTGWSWDSVRVMIGMRQENGGRLLRAAHP
jgi:hypothetical protein